MPEILANVNPRDRLRSVGRRVTDPAEALAQQVTERVVDLLVSVLDFNELVVHVDLNALLSRIDLNALLARVDVDAVVNNVDVNALLDRVDVNRIVTRVDMDTLVQDTDLGALMARSTGGVASDVLDAARSQAVGLDLFVDRWVRRLLRRKETGPDVPPALLPPPVASARAVP